MKTARSFVRRVRSKSPFRRRKHVETIITEVRQKEEAYLKGLQTNPDQTSQPDDQAEIEVVLEPASFASHGRPPRGRSPTKRARQVEDTVPELVASSSASTDEPQVTPAQAAARRFMERQQRIATGNRRKSFRDRFMRSSKNASATSSPPSTTSPAKNTKQMGLSVKGRGIATTSFACSGRDQVLSEPRERGRSKERTVGRAILKGSNSNSKSSAQSRDEKAGISSPVVKGEGAAAAAAPEVPRTTPQYELRKATAEQPVTIEVGAQSRVSELSTPAAIIRQESLGTQSIQGVRQALQKMELELAAAGDAGKRVSRDKIMNALNFMAHSLHYDDQKQALAKELDAWIDESVIGAERLDFDDEDEEEEGSDDDTSTSDDASESTFDLDAFEDGKSVGSSQKQLQTQNSFQDLFLRLGKFFSISDEDKTAVKQALHDLLWAELTDTRAPRPRRRSRSSKGDDGSESSEDSIGNFDPLTCNIQDTKVEPSAPVRGRSWWRRHAREGINTKKENLLPVMEEPPSPASRKSLLSPTGKVNPRHSSRSLGRKASKRGGKSVGNEKSSQSRRSAGSRSLPGKPQPLRKKSALAEHPPVVKSRYMMDESDQSGWSSFDETASDLWRQAEDRYTIPSKSKGSLQQTQRTNHYKLSYTNNWPENDSFLDSESPKEDDDFSDWDNCLHPAENLNH